MYKSVTYPIYYMFIETLLGMLAYDSYKTIHCVWNIFYHLVLVRPQIAFGEHAFQT
jgi:hypothetical protein